ncbi:MAG: GTP-binding protein, partial [Candidatus Jacksonbacteria bacterium]|nr:GTP-binding protein [Candidatus Jacksonbacteria bacterium]
MTPQLPTVVLAGRSNVGKSKLYNKLKEQPSAVVSAIPGTTRDVNETTIQWNGVSFTLVDTAGLDIPQEQDIDQKVIKNTKEALEKADSILFVVDTKHGITPADKDALKELSAFKKNMLLVANKADSQKLAYAAAEFYTLGAGDPHVVSAVTGVGTGDLLDVIIDNLSQKIKTEKNEALIKLAFVGQPNVGKSSLVNALLGEERVLVHESPHTTRDPIDTDLTYKDTLITLVDTAGLRRPVKIKRQTIEDSSVHKTIQRL